MDPGLTPESDQAAQEDTYPLGLSSDTGDRPCPRQKSVFVGLSYSLISTAIHVLARRMPFGDYIPRFQDELAFPELSRPRRRTLAFNLRCLFPEPSGVPLPGAGIHQDHAVSSQPGH